MSSFTSIGLLLAIGVSMVGCTSGPRYDETILNSYRIGMSRDDARLLLRDSPVLGSESRPSFGWSTLDDDGGIANAVIRFERSPRGQMVHACDAFTVFRSSSVALPAVPGMWIDYLFFDAHDKLVGFERESVD